MYKDKIINIILIYMGAKFFVRDFNEKGKQITSLRIRYREKLKQYQIMSRIYKKTDNANKEKSL